MSAIALVYTVFPDEESARAAARAAIAERLAACANILAPCTSIYEWQGEVTENVEIPVILKTTAAQADALIERIAAMHPYEVPAILSWPIVRAPHAFAKWVNGQTDD
ncbi:MAG: divalent-cation tolerance protein CutA [Sphingobium sp. 32-64-5]|nr:MAG: divalent-cation tolerance protein CutA [Sphingobium sp. 32-64-5]